MQVQVLVVYLGLTFDSVSSLQSGRILVKGVGPSELVFSPGLVVYLQFRESKVIDCPRLIVFPDAFLALLYVGYSDCLHHYSPSIISSLISLAMVAVATFSILTKSNCAGDALTIFSNAPVSSFNANVWSSAHFIALAGI